MSKLTERSRYREVFVRHKAAQIHLDLGLVALSGCLSEP